MPFIFAAVGSFLNVVIYRLPRGQSVVAPRSQCPTCGHMLNWIDLVPILSYLMLRARCRYCRARIPLRYAAIEALSMLSLSLVWYNTGNILRWPYVVLAALLIAITFIDYHHFYIPDKLLLVGGGAWVGLRALLPFIELSRALLGLALGFAVMLVIYLLARGGMGFGDVKLTALLGLYLGPAPVLLTLLLSFVVGAAAGILLMILKLKGRKDMLPFGPFLALGAFFTMLWGPAIILWYTQVIGL